MCDSNECCPQVPRRMTRSSTRSAMACEPCSPSQIILPFEFQFFQPLYYSLLSTVALFLNVFLLLGAARSACEKCGKSHDTSDCPYFDKRARFQHADAQPCPDQDRTSASNHPPIKVQDAHVVEMVGDCDCLFHALNYNGDSAGKAK